MPERDVMVVDGPDDVLRAFVAGFLAARGVDLSAVTGTGPGGRIVKEDVLRGREQAGMAPQREGDQYDPGDEQRPT